MMALLKYGAGMPFYRLQSLQAAMAAACFNTVYAL
jgi:hypothetical protein